MHINELHKLGRSDEKLQWVYDMILVAYHNGEDSITVSTERLSLVQYNYLRDVKGYTMNTDPYLGDTISGW